MKRPCGDWLTVMARPRLRAELLERLLKKLWLSDLAVFVDLSPATLAAGKSSIAGWLDVLAGGQVAVALSLCQATAALGFAVPSSGPRRCELGLACSSESLAEKIRVDVPEAGARRSRDVTLADCRTEGDPAARQVSVRGGRPVQATPRRTARALRTARCDTVDGIVRLRFGWERAGAPWFSVVAAGESTPAIRLRRLAAARTVDTEQSPRAAAAACCCMRRGGIRCRSFPTGWPADRRR